MRRPAVPKTLLEGLLCGLSGFALYVLLAGAQVALEANPVVVVVMEESVKMAALLLAGWLGLRQGRLQAAGDRRSATRVRVQSLGIARGLSLGLVTISVFVGAETLAYALKFAEAGVLARLFWSMPVHLVAALLESLGILHLLRSPGPLHWRRHLISAGACLASLILAMAWHGLANQMAEGPLAHSTYLLGAVTANVLFLLLLMRFFRQAYLGGFLHGSDECESKSGG